MINTTHIEYNILGTLIMWPESYRAINQVVYPFMFSEKSRPLAEYVWGKIAEGEGLEIGVVVTDVQAMNIATAEKIFEITEAPAMDDISLYADKLKEAYVIKEDSNRYNNALKALMGGQPYNDVRSSFERDFEALQAMVEIKADTRHQDFLNAYNHLVKGLENDGLNGVPTGFQSLDEFTGGWQGGNYILVGARPGMGKTTVALDFAYAAALAGRPGAVFSLEMTNREIIYKLTAKQSGIPPWRLVQSLVSKDDLPKVWTGMEFVSELPIYVFDDTNIDNTLQSIRDKAYQVQREHGLEWIVVDYLQLMKGEGNSKNEKVESISQGFKRLAKRLNIPVIVLSQLSRQVEIRGGVKRPLLSDLRDSGSLEQDADIIIFPYRPEYYEIKEDEEGQSLEGKVELIFAKNRMGGKPTSFWFEYNNKKDSYLDVAQAPFTPNQSEAQLMEIPAGSRPGNDEDVPF